MHVVVVFLEAKRGQQGKLRQALMEHAQTCLDVEPGCQRYDVGFDPLDGTSFLAYQIYDDEAAFNAHRELPHYAEFRLRSDPWLLSRRVLTYEQLTVAGNA